MQDFDSLGDEHRSSKAYLEIMVRRLRDCVGLHAPEDNAPLMIGMGENGGQEFESAEFSTSFS